MKEALHDGDWVREILIFSLMTALFWFGNKVFLIGGFPHRGAYCAGK